MKLLTRVAVVLAMFCIGVIVAPLFVIFPKDDTHEG
jgi:hypothetical protein